MFLRNCWYVAAQPAEIGREPLARRVCGDALVLYRRRNGTVVAMQDQCPHRKYALSKGRVEGDEIRCLYHGLTFDPSGACTFIPGQERIPEKLCARVYPCVEKYHWVWVWLGDAALADESSVPDFGLHVHPDWRTVFGCLRIESDYRLILDNFLDLTHVGYVHVGTIGNAPVSAAPMEVRAEADRVTFTRFIYDVPPPPTFTRSVVFDGNVDRWQKATFLPPSNFLNDIRAVPAGTEDEARGLHFVVNNSLTPESASSTLYFWSVSRNYRLDDANTGDVLRDEMIKAFLEDKAVIELQQDMIDIEQPATPIIPIKADAAALAMRRMLEKLQKAEGRPGSKRRAAPRPTIKL